MILIFFFLLRLKNPSRYSIDGHCSPQYDRVAHLLVLFSVNLIFFLNIFVKSQNKLEKVLSCVFIYIVMIFFHINDDKVQKQEDLTGLKTYILNSSK